MNLLIFLAEGLADYAGVQIRKESSKYYIQPDGEVFLESEKSVSYQMIQSLLH